MKHRVQNILFINKFLKERKEKSRVSQLQQLDQTSLFMALQIKIKKVVFIFTKNKKKKKKKPSLIPSDFFIQCFFPKVVSHCLAMNILSTIMKFWNLFTKLVF